MKTYRQSISFVIVLTIIASLGTSFGSAATRPQRYLSEFIPDTLKTQLSPNAATFERVSIDALGKLDIFNNKIEELRRRGNVTAQEKATIQTDGNALKSLLANLKSSLSSLVDQLKSANKFTGDFDSLAVNSIRAKKPEAANKLVGLGGARALLNANIASLSAAITEINNIQADPLFRRTVGAVQERDFGQVRGYSLLPVAHTTATTAPAPPVRFSITVIKCGVLGARLLIKTIKGTDTQQDVDNFQNCDN